MLKSMKGIFICMLLFIMMVIQSCNVYATDASGGVPNQLIAASSTYRQIPVYWEENEVTEFSTYLRKYNDTAGNKNERFDISGTATFRVRAYAYETGNNVKLGTYIECLDEDGNWFEMDWRDQEDQVSDTDLAAFIEGNKNISISITDIQFTMPNQNENDLRVTFNMEASTGHKFSRPTNKNVKFVSKSGMNITRTVTEVSHKKNVWEVEIKVQGNTEKIIPQTDVVLILDRSGSMAETKCRKDEHQHKKSCRDRGGKLICTQEEHTHSAVCVSTRARLVQEASEKLVDSLVAEKNVNIAIVSFGGNSSRENIKYEHYKKGTWDAFETGRGKDDWYSNYTVNTSFTNSSSDLKRGIATALEHPEGGTPMSLGVIKAGLLLKDRNADNKIIILLSDGEPTYIRDGSGSGNRNDETQNAETDKDTISAANEVKSKIPDVKIYTIAAGDSIGKAGKSLLSKCATDESYAYQAEDTTSALEAVMGNIAVEINNSIAEGLKLTDVISENFTLILPEDKMTTNVRIVSSNKMKDIDWSETGLAISQGEIQKLSNGRVEWNIGKSTAEVPAIMKYRIYMKSGKLGVPYNVSSQGKVEYMDVDHKVITLAVPNKSIKASWARVNVASYINKSNSKVSGSDFTIWMDVPDSYKEGSLIIGRKTKFSSSSSEIADTGDMTIDDKVVVPTSTQEGGSTNKLDLITIVANEKDYSTEEYGNVIVLTKVVTEVEYRYAAPLFEATLDANNNFIQPEGITNISTDITFKTKSKNVSYEIDTSNLVNEMINGEKLMNYQLDKAIVQIVDLNNSLTLSNGTHYTIQGIVDNKIVIKFNSFIEADAKYKISIYIPTTMGNMVVYGGADANTYLNKYFNKIGTIDTILKAFPKVDEVILETGHTVEVYSNMEFSTQKAISLKYLEIAKIN